MSDYCDTQFLSQRRSLLYGGDRQDYFPASFSSSLRILGFTLPGHGDAGNARASFAVARLFSAWSAAATGALVA